VLEGYVEKVVFTGLQNARLESMALPVTSEQPLRMPTLERSLLLINELSGVSAQANLKAGDAPNSSILEVVVNQSRNDFSLSAHNRVAPSEGTIRYTADASFNGVLGTFDRHKFSAVSSGDQRLGFLSYDIEAPLGSQGLKATASVFGSRSVSESALGEVRSSSNNLAFGLNYPIILSRQSTVGVRASLGGDDNSSETLSTLTSKSSIRLSKLGFTASFSDSLGGVNVADWELTKGLSGMGASLVDDPFLQGSNPLFIKRSLYAARLQNLGFNWSLLFALEAQFSPDRLPSTEQLGLGGETFLRGYDASEVIGENGSAGKLELRYSLALGSFNLTLYSYADAGQVSRSQIGGAPDLQYALSSAGLGLRFSGPRRVKGFVEYAKPNDRIVASQGNTDGRVFAGLGADF
jgi:hemolysin activation/secretion protein